MANTGLERLAASLGLRKEKPSTGVSFILVDTGDSSWQEHIAKLVEGKGSLQIVQATSQFTPADLEKELDGLKGEYIVLIDAQIVQWESILKHWQQSSDKTLKVGFVPYKNYFNPAALRDQRYALEAGAIGFLTKDYPSQGFTPQQIDDLLSQKNTESPGQLENPQE